MRAIVLSIGIMAIAFPANAQSSVTLEEFNLDDKPAVKQQVEVKKSTSSDMESCLLDQDNCKNKKFKSAASFSIDDVINLGIIDPNEVRAQPDSTSTQSQILPSIDMEILFDYDSHTLRSDQYRKLFELSNILKNDQFDRFKFAFLGHSDAKGEAEYNRGLSFRRAQSVSEFLASASRINQSRFISTGLGSSNLKHPDDPFGSANRRVQLVLIPVK